MAGRSNLNVDSIGHQSFKPEPPRDPPATHHQASGAPKHQLGVQAKPNDQVPVFHAQKLPPGTAPKESTYRPNPVNTVPSQADNDNVLRSHGKESTYTHPNDTLGGATSADVHTGLGKPLSGQTNSEIRRDGHERRKRDGSGYEGVGATGHPKHQEGSIGDSQLVDPHQNASQRGLDREKARGGQHGDKGILGAEDHVPESATTVASERPG
ncbi:hypothetical protein VTN31DRAFT_1474 [Thermomyces dupontii]|uniref:uncharacterized protein n=1 Tax=Talaromyces thermophilus TaxID=28565 RepID=UPI0037439A27